MLLTVVVALEVDPLRLSELETNSRFDFDVPAFEVGPCRAVNGDTLVIFPEP